MSQYAWENPSLEGATAAAIGDAIKQLRTAMPGRVVSFDPSTQTAVVQPLIRMMKADGQGMDLPPLGDVPVQFPEAGGFAITFPLVPGDEGLLVIADRCIDGWWQSGQPADPMDFRLHDLSDGFFIPGVNSVPNAIPNFDMGAIVVRKFDGSAYFKIDAGGNIEAGGTKLTVKCPAIFEQPVTYQQGISGAGNFAVSGGTMTHNGANVGSNHTHSGIQPGGSNTGGPQ